jgi:hypothetical protein
MLSRMMSFSPSHYPTRDSYPIEELKTQEPAVYSLEVLEIALWLRALMFKGGFHSANEVIAQ